VAAQAHPVLGASAANVGPIRRGWGASMSSVCGVFYREKHPNCHPGSRRGAEAIRDPEIELSKPLLGPQGAFPGSRIALGIHLARPG